MKISILCTNINHPVIPSLKKWKNETSSKGHKVSLIYDKKDLKGGDILFLVSCSQIIKDAEKLKYKAALVLHASDLPRGRGWSPHVWEILEGKNKLTMTLLQAEDPVDTGDIWVKKEISLQGNELVDDINNKIFGAELEIMSYAIDNFKTIKPKKQTGKASSYFRKRTPEDSRIDPSKTIKDQFNILRVSDYERYPAFFEYMGKKYKINIEEYKIEEK